MSEILQAAPVNPGLWGRIRAYDYGNFPETAVHFITAHQGCIVRPFVTGAILGNGATRAASYGMSVVIGMASMSSLDAVVRSVQVDECMRCINAKLDGVKRQGKIAAQAVLMSSFMFFSHQLTGQHGNNEVQRDRAGRRFIARDGSLCGLGFDHKADTLWLDRITPPLQPQPKTHPQP